MAQVQTPPKMKARAAAKKKTRTKGRVAASVLVGAPPRHRGSRRVAPKPGSVVGRRITDALVEAGYTQSQLARLLAGDGAMQPSVESVRRLILKWLSGANEPSMEYALKLSQIFEKDNAHFTNVTLDDSARDAVVFIRQAALELQEPAFEPLSGKLEFNEIAALFPHFNEQHLLVDEVLSVQPGKHVAALRRGSVEEWPFGAFYRTAEMIPGFVLAEALAQTAAIALLAQPENRTRVVLCAAFNSMRFRQIVPSGDDLFLDATITHVAGPIVHADVRATLRSGEVAVRGRLTLAVH